MAEDESACCSNGSVSKLLVMNAKSNVLKGNRIRNQARPLKLLNRHHRSSSRQRFRASVTSSRTCPLSFIVLSLAFLSMPEFSLVAANESNFFDTMTGLRPVSNSNNNSSSRSSGYETATGQSSSTALRKVYTNQFAIRITGGDVLEADKLAAKHGFINLGPVCFFFLKFLKSLKNSIYSG